MHMWYRPVDQAAKAISKLQIQTFLENLVSRHEYVFKPVWILLCPMSSAEVWSDDLKRLLSQWFQSKKGEQIWSQ